jgi:RsiW-degrading membrane proteinase PrsW (M82 family)
MFTYILILATLPSLVVLVIFFWADRHEKESLFLLFRSFAYGAAIPVVIALLQALFQDAYQALTRAQQVTLVAPLLEEGLKFAVALGVLYRSADLNEPYDGILYYVACGVGFAVHELLAPSSSAVHCGCSGHAPSVSQPHVLLH